MSTAILTARRRVARRSRALPLDTFIPDPDIRERFSVTIEAPAALVMQVATTIDMQSLPIVRATFRLREILMRAGTPPPREPKGILEETLGLGWGKLADEPGRLVVCGASCQPWLANTTFTPIPPASFRAYDTPGQVKIAWSLEAFPLGPSATLFSHETRAVATDEEAHAKFRRYWRWARVGIIGIRLVLMPTIRREAERRFADQLGAPR